LVHIDLLFECHVLKLFSTLLVHRGHELFSSTDQSLFEEATAENTREFCVRDQIFICKRADFKLNCGPNLVAVKGDSLFNEEGQNRLEGKLADQADVITFEVHLCVSVPKVFDRIGVLFKGELFLLDHLGWVVSANSAAELRTRGYSRVRLVGGGEVFLRLEEIVWTLGKHLHVGGVFLLSVLHADRFAETVFRVDFVGI